jgi:hypothetical protein
MPEFNVKWNGYETTKDSPLEAAKDGIIILPPRCGKDTRKR